MYDGKQDAKPCKACGKLIVFLYTTTGKRIPVNYDSLTEEDKRIVHNAGPIDFNREVHKTHFADCPAAKDFRKRDARKG